MDLQEQSITAQAVTQDGEVMETPVTNFKKGDFVYVISRNSIGEVLDAYPYPLRGVQEVRTDVDGMRDGIDLEHLNASHFQKPGVFMAVSTASRFRVGDQ